MFMHQTEFRMAEASPSVAAVLQAGSRRVRALAEQLRVWLVKQRVAEATLRDVRTMSGRELHDIGLNRADVPSVGWDAWIDITGRI